MLIPISQLLGEIRQEASMVFGAFDNRFPTNQTSINH
jgi:hypothetical protein